MPEWKLAKDSQERVTQSPTELCVMLELPDKARKAIHGWVLEQDWPEGTDLHEPHEYHITLMYAPDGYDEHKDADWIEHLDSVQVRITGIDTFTADPEGRIPYVLRLHAPDVKQHAEEMQRRAEEDHGLEITHFPGGYKPHITVGYGPTEELSADDIVELEFHAGPSVVAPPRKDKEAAQKTTSMPERGVWSVLSIVHGDNIMDPRLAVKAPEPPSYRAASGKDRCGTCKMNDEGICWGYGNKEIEPFYVCDSYEMAPGYHQSFHDPFADVHIAMDGHPHPYDPYEPAQVLDTLSLKSVAHNLHYKWSEGVSPEEIVGYAQRLLKMIGYDPDEMNTMAALQAWQTLYPSDPPVGLSSSGDKGALPANGDTQAPATTPTQSWGYGTVSSWPGVVYYIDPLRVAAIGEKPLYHWTDVSDLESWTDPSHTGPGHTYLTEDGDSPDQNPDVPVSDQPVRITIDPAKLDPAFLDPHYEGWLGNHLYLAPIPKDAIAEIKAFRKPSEDDWDFGNTEPTPEDRWPEYGGRPSDNPHDVQFTNNW